MSPGAAAVDDTERERVESGAQGQQGQQGRERTRRGQRSVAEWVTLAASVVVVVALLGATSYFHFTGPDGPAVIEVQPQLNQVFRGGDSYYLPVKVRNVGQQTGEDVRVRLSLVDGEGQRHSAELTVHFLAGGAWSEGVVAFPADPRQGHVVVDTVSYLKP